jgi:hypothetical protein
MARRRLELQVGSNAAILHLVGRHPASGVELGFDPLSAQLLDNVGYSYPEHADRHGIVACPIIYGEFDLVSLVNLKLMNLVGPSLGLGRLGTAFEDILDLHYDKCIRSSAESSGSGVIHIRNCVHTY